MSFVAISLSNADSDFRCSMGDSCRISFEEQLRERNYSGEIVSVFRRSLFHRGSSFQFEKFLS